uniref:J domain-containing protein n=2 Tax=Emiliania huxleyi TaxID=2903 RepID=A0A7S3SGY2_EMIHU|mmetsp:Transcript_30841/g.100729  ORF Transcript_30841/g.100729 Transcript_30841/m.100729 type:complete len:264 (+) Transcript_30841:964-1755(+)
MSLCDSEAATHPCAAFVVELGGGGGATPLSAGSVFRVSFWSAKISRAELSRKPLPRLTTATAGAELPEVLSFVRLPEEAPPQQQQQQQSQQQQRRERKQQQQQQWHQQQQQARGQRGRGGGRFPQQQQAPKQKVRDYYAILSVKRGASKREIKKAYHAAAKRWHPDKNRAEGQEARLEKAERNFKLIARAYEVLSDPDTRAAYDRGENVDDPKWAQRQSAQQEAQRRGGNVRFNAGPQGQQQFQRKGGRGGGGQRRGPRTFHF